MPPRQIGDVLTQLIARRGYAREQSASQLDDAWRQAVGQALAKLTRAGAVRRGTLEVTVSNNLLVQELGFQKAEILKRLGQLAPDAGVKGLRFRVGRVS